MSGNTYMDAILLHGMGRTPIAMSLLAARLYRANIRPHPFGYSVTFERWNDCVKRLERFITRRIKTDEYIIVAHSFGTVLTRAVLQGLVRKPKACFFLAPPTQACMVARKITHHTFAKLLGGESGQLLANTQFMNSLPVPCVPTKIYAGVGGPRGGISPFGEEPNDGVLTVSETLLPGVPLQLIPTIHPFLVYSKVVAGDIVKLAKSHPTNGEWQ